MKALLGLIAALEEAASTHFNALEEKRKDMEMCKIAQPGVSAILDKLSESIQNNHLIFSKYSLELKKEID